MASPACADCGRPFIRNHPDQRFCGKVRGKNRCKDRARAARYRALALAEWLGIDSARQRFDDGSMVGDQLWFEPVDEA